MRTIPTLLGVALAAAVPGAAADAATKARSATFTLVAPDTEESRLDLGAKGPSQGDLYVFAGPLLDKAGKPRGRLDGHCVTISVPEAGDREQDRWQCIATATIGVTGGETEIQLQGVGRILADDVVLSITGGSGIYAAARGEALFDRSTPGRTTVTFRVLLR